MQPKIPILLRIMIPEVRCADCYACGIACTQSWFKPLNPYANPGDMSCVNGSRCVEVPHLKPGRLWGADQYLRSHLYPVMPRCARSPH